MLKGNKGEWSEIYVFLYLLSKKGLYGGDENLKKIVARFYPIKKIFRTEKKTCVIYDLQTSGSKKIRILINKKKPVEYPVSGIRTAIPSLLKAIRSAKSASFSYAKIDKVLKKLYVEKLKTSGSRKGDIDLELHDLNTQIDRRVEFSIKSQLGAASTLLNASAATNFKYSISGINNVQMQSINAIGSKSKIRDRVNKILANKGVFNFHSITYKVFEDNLKLIDSVMGLILSECMLSYYSGQADTVKKAIEILAAANPLLVSNAKIFYAYKMKQFLLAIALGMQPASLWDGINQANGGYIVLKSNGEVVCFYIYDQEYLKEYLFNNTKFESPSATRHKYGSLYNTSVGMFFDLNLQIRFKA